MHRVVVIPLAAPDEAVPFKNLDDLVRDEIAVGNRLTDLSSRPPPVVRELGGNIDGDAVPVGASLFRAGDRPADVGSGWWN